MRPPTEEEARLIAALDGLIARERDEMTSDELAARKLHDEADRAALRAFATEHARHMAHLTLLLHTLGARQHDQRADLRRRLARLRVTLAGLVGDDAALLHALKSVEEATSRAYLGAMTRNLPPRILAVLEHDQREELRHAAWIEERIGRLRRSRAA